MRLNIRKRILKQKEIAASIISLVCQEINMAWSIANNSLDDKTKLQALTLINDCNKYKMDLTTNGVVITNAIKLVQTNKEKLTTATSKEDNKESNEPDYDDDELEEKRETGELNQGTTNNVF
jgi:hypothetical protein